MTDPRFPNRPDHPDFWIMAEAVQDFDSAADDGTAMPRIVESMVDLDSLLYMAEQRALRAAKMVNPFMARTPDTERIKLQSMWIDAFMAGALYQKYKSERAEK